VGGPVARLRHLDASLMLKEGVPVHVMAHRLGHADPIIALRVDADADVVDDLAGHAAFAFIFTSKTLKG